MRSIDIRLWDVPVDAGLRACSSVPSIEVTILLLTEDNRDTLLAEDCSNSSVPRIDFSMKGLQGRHLTSGLCRPVDPVR